MARTRTSSTWLVLWGGLAFVSFWPVPALQRGLEVALVPLRAVAELGSPFALLGRRRVSAAERALAGRALAEAAEGEALLASLAARALPSDPELRAGRHFVPAQVLERPSKDECWLEVGDVRALEPGAPVVCGDAYVGRLLEVRAGAAPRVRVQLVTAQGFRVGAEVRGEPPAEPVYLTVGGLRVPRAGRAPRSVRLAAHQPSSSALAGGLARVRELFADSDASAGLAAGFRLGEVRRESERGPWWLEPELDFLDGLFQLAIVVRAEPGELLAARPPSALADGRWLTARALTLGDPSPWRSTLKLPLGRGDGVEPGAAVTGAGARLLGRVLRAGRATSDVALLADPGFSLPAVARIDGDSEPRVLGRLRTLGRAADGAIRLRWFVRVPLAPAADAAADTEADAEALPARLYSGSGDPGLPGGLHLGSALLPRSARAGEEREILLRPGVEPADVRTLYVRRAAEGARP